MVIGNGMIAQKFLEYKDDSVVFFASGVSNSNETCASAFEREKQLLEKTMRRYSDKTLVYFSSCDIENVKVANQPYYKHKAQMESIIAASMSSFYIYRLAQVVGRSHNKHTLMNFFVEKVKHGLFFEVWTGTKKSLIDIEDVFTIISYCIDNKLSKNAVCNIFNHQYISVLELIKLIEDFLNTKATFHAKEIDNTYYYNSACMNKIDKLLKIDFKNNYFQGLLKKYYSEVDCEI